MLPDSPSTASRRALGVQMTLIAAMVIWGLNVTVVKQLTTSFDLAPVSCSS